MFVVCSSVSEGKHQHRSQQTEMEPDLNSCGEAVNGCLTRAVGLGRKEKKATGRIGIGTSNPHGSEVEAGAVNSLREKGVESRAWLRLEASIH